MKESIEYVWYTIAIVAWIAGIVIAQGIWSTAISVIMPLWAWYLLIERLMQLVGLV